MNDLYNDPVSNTLERACANWPSSMYTLSPGVKRLSASGNEQPTTGSNGFHACCICVSDPSAGPGVAASNNLSPNQIQSLLFAANGANFGNTQIDEHANGIA